MIYFKFVLQVIVCFFAKKCKHIFDGPLRICIAAAPSPVDVRHPAPSWLRWHQARQEEKVGQSRWKACPSSPLTKYRKAEAKHFLLTNSSNFYHTPETCSVS